MKIKAILENDNKGSTTFFTEKGRFTINYEEINYINQEIMKDPEQKYNFYDSIIDVVAEYINAKLDYLLMRESIEERRKEEEQYQEVLNKEIMEKIDSSLKDIGFENVTFLSVNDIEEQKENLKLPYETQSVIDFINDLLNKNKRTLH